MPYEGWLPRCAICKQSVDLNEGKTDECGRAVHEDCYVSLLTGKKRRELTLRIDAPRVGGHLPMNCGHL
jgi:hypothetical protein